MTRFIFYRFSQDLELIDDELPSSLELTVNAALSCVVEGFLVFIGSSYVTAAVIPVCVLVIYYVAKFYVQTSRQMRLLDIEAKAPLFSQFLEALNGLSSIRAYGWTEDYHRRNQIALDASQRPSYLLYCIQRWIGLVLDLIVACIAVIVVAVAISMKGSPSMNLLGIALFNIVNFSGTLQTLVTYWIGLETSIGAVSRIRSYVLQATTEDLDSETDAVPEDWPQHGGIDIAGLSASYEYVLGCFLGFFRYMLNNLLVSLRSLFLWELISKFAPAKRLLSVAGLAGLCCPTSGCVSHSLIYILVGNPPLFRQSCEY